MQNSTKKNTFRIQLNKYLDIKGLDIVVLLDDGKEIELYKNRKLVKNEIIYSDKSNKELRINIARIKSIDLYAAQKYYLIDVTSPFDNKSELIWLGLLLF